MSKQQQIIDLDFAVSQLSGNQPLLIKLLLKFNEQYKDLAQELANFKQNDDFKTYKEVVHTVKGVSGNLGLNALHLSSKNLETSVINQADITVAEATFLTHLSATINEINRLANEDETTTASDSEPPQKSSRGELIAMLENNEFITPDKLEALLVDSGVTDTDKQALHSAINDLDYAEALNIIHKSR